MTGGIGVRSASPAALVAGFVVLLANSAYLVTRADPTLFYFANVGLHPVLGLLLWAGLASHLRRGWGSLGALAKAASVLLVASATLGAVLMVTGATRPYRALLVTHVVLATAGAALLLTHLVAVARRLAGLPAGRALGLGAAAGWTAIAVGAGALAVGQRRAPERDRIVNPALPPASMEGEGAGSESPFFPSSAETNVGGIIPANFFMTSAACGRCHKEIYDQWNSSAHHFSSFNNQWYRKSIEYMQDVIGTKPSKWCAGCHDHAVFFNGRFDRPIKEQIHTPEAQAGLACTSCHSIVHVKSSMGQGDFTIEYPPLHDLAVSEQKVLSWSHDYLLRLAPRPHRETFLKNFHTVQTAEFCSACHKVHLDVPVNDYRWFRGFNEYDNWQASGVSGQGARSFYYPKKAQKCADCHMPLMDSKDPGARDGKIHSHRFPAANTALPYVNQDAEQLKVIQDFLRDGQVSVDVFAIVRTGEAKAPLAARAAGAAESRLASTFAQGEETMSYGGGQAFLTPPAEVIGPIDKIVPSVRRGESVRVEVVVRTRKVGHFFPGGTVDAFDVWVELLARDDKGRVVFHSGAVEGEGKGPVEPGAHFYRSLQLDDHGNVINKRNAWMTRSVAYVRLIPPGAADTIHYRLRVPEDCDGPLHLEARVNYRKFSWWNTQWAFAGIRDPEDKGYSITKSHDDGRWLFTGSTADVSGKVKGIPDIPITVMAEAKATLEILPKGATEPQEKPFLDRSVRERWNDYGIGLLLQGDLKGAEAAFQKVTEMEPEYADGWVNIARAQVQEGNMEAAEPILRKALEIDPKLVKTHFFLAAAVKADGRYDEALQHLRVAAAQYPRDRVVLNQEGRILFLQRKYDAAIAAFRRVLEIDPEDLQAHYNLMLCWRGKGKTENAEREQKLYERFKVDETAQFITGPYRQLHPDDNNERQQIHEHVSIPLGGPGTRGAYAAAGKPKAGGAGASQ
jgi:tetratricopeptide (TPR) repeat protein